ncbi:MAG: polysaccharide biosynthesis protein, partial [Terriglobales bacterium]
GEPVRVLDLAKDMIRLSGFTLGEDMEIEIVGLRPGEKLHEELLRTDEVRKSRLEKIFVVEPAPFAFDALPAQVEALIQCALRGDELGIRELFQGMRIGYRPQAADRQLAAHAAM